MKVPTDYAKHGNVNPEVDSDYAKHGNVNPDVNSGNPEVDSDCAKHGNVNLDVDSGNPEVDSDCAKHRNVNPDVDSGNPDVDSVKNKGINYSILMLRLLTLLAKVHVGCVSDSVTHPLRFFQKSNRIFYILLSNVPYSAAVR
ncbi:MULTISPECIES: hypothetical protein [unclassified Tolypothrix]|uniref:hypothetical protein n=1 Tax=unclassified Tolypothrix TaxID=2649714 RepID=UPI0005EABFA7|nr:MULTISPECIES: hypothetical protein [unclassified Tolypothrix]EKF00387.1 hypothetical protein FDUTEX481_09048 [Tolypothrix sp. PCC 7601]MBE9081847.1 hypothetical protein [Tolypothrix sp. LEGE 11397]UYD37134.1 hypothetical protein HG267_16235 [Tolypothrix sp. PCC 7601]BAY93132.1 hypothetical protein NIES3275_51690 [Microchaete diplosiphon NIES-3275]